MFLAAIDGRALEDWLGRCRRLQEDNGCHFGVGYQAGLDQKYLLALSKDTTDNTQQDDAHRATLLRDICLFYYVNYTTLLAQRACWYPYPSQKNFTPPCCYCLVWSSIFSASALLHSRSSFRIHLVQVNTVYGHSLCFGKLISRLLLYLACLLLKLSPSNFVSIFLNLHTYIHPYIYICICAYVLVTWAASCILYTVNRALPLDLFHMWKHLHILPCCLFTLWFSLCEKSCFMSSRSCLSFLLPFGKNSKNTAF